MTDPFKANAVWQKWHVTRNDMSQVGFLTLIGVCVGMGVATRPYEQAYQAAYRRQHRTTDIGMMMQSIQRLFTTKPTPPQPR